MATKAEEIASIFEEIASVLPRSEQFRARAYKVSAGILRDLREGMDEMTTDQLKEAGLGDGSVAKVIEFVTTGQIKTLWEVRVKYGAPLPASQDPKRMPREKAAAIVEPIIAKMKERFPQIRIMICGSYRRLRATVKDIDILVAVPRHGELTTREVAGYFYGLLDKDMGQYGEARSRQMGAQQVRDYHKGLLCDLTIVPEESWACAVVFWTGSGDFNVKMRGYAKRKGYALNRYNLTNRVTGEVIPTTDEVSVFHALGLDYMTPSEREENKRLRALRTSIAV